MDNNINIESKYSSSCNSFSQVLLRFITSTVILAITTFFTPGFSINNIWALLLASIILTIMDLLIVKFTNLNTTYFGKGFTGFVLAIITLYLTQYFIAGYSISWLSAILGALIYGIVDFFIPGTNNN